jgi:hypothetical protein
MVKSTGKPLSSVRKFYLLEYFYVLLNSVEKYSDLDQIFELFKALKEEHRLGESKYKKLTVDNQNLSQVQLVRYQYTFEKVIAESVEYELIIQDGKKIFLTENGKILLDQYEEGFEFFAVSLFKLMEGKYEAFRSIIELLYSTSKTKTGLFIFPIYSPIQLHFNRSKIRTSADIKKYSQTLVKRLEQDIRQYLGESRDLSSENAKLLENLIEDELIPRDLNAEFPQNKYNAITTRFRNYWLKYFLQEIYHYEFYLSSFEIWTYRAKQIGIIHATEFYPYFNGKIIYPTSVIIKSTPSRDFEKIYEYSDGFGLFVHKPNIEENQEKFIDYLVKAYFDLRKTNRSYFISLSALREMVCYNMKISEYIFEQFLDSVYRANLSGKLKIKISLEVDRLPEETKAIYLKQEPVMVDGKFRNIIAIDVAKGGIR